MAQELFLLKLPESANKCKKKVLKVPQGAQQKPNISKKLVKSKNVKKKYN